MIVETAAAEGEKTEVKTEKSERGGTKSRSRSRARKDEKKDVLTLDRIKVCKTEVESFCKIDVPNNLRLQALCICHEMATGVLCCFCLFTIFLDARVDFV